MGNCAGYCTGCKDDTHKQDANQIRYSMKEKDIILSQGFEGKYGQNE